MFGLEIGCRSSLLVRQERIAGREPNGQPWRMLYASDLHLTARRAHVADNLAAVAAEHAPDVVMFGGDLVDRRAGLDVLRDCTQAMAKHVPVVAVPGNHDMRFGPDAVRNAVVDGGGRWLPEGAARFESPGRPELRLDAEPAPPEDPNVRRILVAHWPGIAEAAALHGYDLVMAGHLHGGQCVLWHRGTMLYPGAWFSRWNGLRFELGGTTMLVSRGAADTLPVRFRCPREVILVELH